MKLGGAVRRQSAVDAEFGGGGAYRSGCRELGDGDVVRVSVTSFGAEGDNHLGLNAPDMSGNGSDRKVGPNLIDCAVRIA
jgi:hypothetical protein